MRQQSLSETLRKRDENDHLKGETLPMEQRCYRMKVVATFFQEGIPLSKLDGPVRNLLKENGLRFTAVSHLRQFILTVLQEEIDTIKTELSGRPVSLIFDGTTRLDEAIAVVIRFMDDKSDIC